MSCIHEIWAKEEDGQTYCKKCGKNQMNVRFERQELEKLREGKEAKG